ncbi:MAG: DUF4428 domain-containing protein [Firmicutes bacterium]|nr:DUF4428 domain-containing protein [Bacillota bacterium]
MGFLGGLFEKKYCAVCGNQVSFFGKRKISDGLLCKDCEAKLSDWFDDRRTSTIAQIKEQLDYREENRKALANFKVTKTMGDGDWRLLIDEEADSFLITAADIHSIVKVNPDIIRRDEVITSGYSLGERKTEETQLVDGKRVSYDPPRFEYSYNIKVELKVRNPYFDEMSFQVHPTTLHLHKVEWAAKPKLGEDHSDVTKYLENAKAEQAKIEQYTQVADEIAHWLRREAYYAPQAAAVNPTAAAVSQTPLQRDAQAFITFCNTTATMPEKAHYEDLQKRIRDEQNEIRRKGLAVTATGKADLAALDQLAEQVTAAYKEAVLRCSGV